MKETDTVFLFNAVQSISHVTPTNAQSVHNCYMFRHYYLTVFRKLTSIFLTHSNKIGHNQYTYVVVPTEQNCIGFGHNCVHKFNIMPVKQ
jgi:hypothetical protein